MIYYEDIQTAKENLPHIVEQIDILDICANSSLELYKSMVDACVKELTNESLDYGLFTDSLVMENVYFSYLRAKTYKEYLEKVVEKIKIHAKNT